MKHAALTAILLCLCYYMVTAQASKYRIRKTSEIEYFLDPQYPEYPTGDASSADIKGWQKAMEKYAADHPPYPVYVNTGDVSADENTYASAIEAWFMRNRYYPQYIDTGNPAADYANWTKAKSEWCKRYPESCTQVEKAQH